MAQAVSGESAATLSSPVWLVDRVPSAECRAAGQPLRLPHAVAGPLPGDSCRPAAPAPQRALINVPPVLFVTIFGTKTGFSCQTR